jgi:TPR repeat protein
MRRPPFPRIPKPAAVPTSSARRGWLAIVIALAFGALPGVGLHAAEKAKAKKKPEAKEAADSKPVLMSRTGGGWSNVKELQAAADKGNPKAQAQFGEMLLRGADGVTPDRARALGLIEKAARAGESSAMFRIGMLLDDGDGVAQDRARALEYFRAAAAGGAVEAMHNIGAAYASARGVKRDYTEALAWLMLAKKRGAPSDGEAAVRARVEKQGRPEAIAAAERRLPELEKELAAKKPAEFLPPAAPFAPAPVPASAPAK